MHNSLQEKEEIDWNSSEFNFFADQEPREEAFKFTKLNSKILLVASVRHLAKLSRGARCTNKNL